MLLLSLVFAPFDIANANALRRILKSHRAALYDERPPAVKPAFGFDVPSSCRAGSSLGYFLKYKRVILPAVSFTGIPAVTMS